MPPELSSIERRNLRVRPALPVYQVVDVASTEQPMRSSRGSNFRPRLKLLGTSGGLGQRAVEEMSKSDAPPPPSREQLKREEIQHEVVEHHLKQLERRNKLHVMDPTANHTRAISMALCERDGSPRAG